MEKAKKAKKAKNTITVKLADVLLRLDNLKEFLKLPKPPLISFKLQMCFAKEISPAIMAFQKEKQTLAEKYEVSEPLSEIKGETPEQWTKRLNAYLARQKKAEAELKPLLEESLELSIEKIDAETCFEYLQEYNEKQVERGGEEIETHTEFIIDWLFI